MKTCPYCAEEIKDEAIRCKHCQADLVDKAANKPVTHVRWGLVILIAVLASAAMMAMITCVVMAQPN